MTLWLPTIPYSLVDCINRIGLATGSIRSAMAGSTADYNGHHVTVSFNDYRQYWVAEYFWAGRVVLARGSLADCLAAAKAEYDRGAKGCTVVANVRSEEEAAVALAAGFQAWSEEIERTHNATWRDARYDEVNGAMELERHGLGPAVGYLANSATVEEYNAKLDAWRAERRREREAR